MKNLSLFAVLFLLIIIVSKGQNQGSDHQPKTAGERAEQQSQRLTQDLNLSADQTAKVKAIILDQEQKADQIKAKYKTSQDKSGERQEMETLRQNSEAEIKKVLSADQITKFESQRKGPRGQEGSHEGHQGGGGKGDHKKGNR